MIPRVFKYFSRALCFVLHSAASATSQPPQFGRPRKYFILVLVAYPSCLLLALIPPKGPRSLAKASSLPSSAVAAAPLGSRDSMAAAAAFMRVRRGRPTHEYREGACLAGVADPVVAEAAGEGGRAQRETP